MGSTKPPQGKGKIPHYDHDKLDTLQKQYDELEDMGVFATPEKVGITAENLNLSFLVGKPNGGHIIITSFAEVGKYCCLQPSLMSYADNTCVLMANGSI